MTDAELDAVRLRVVQAPPGPWVWEHGYEMSLRHWCLANPLDPGRTIDHNLVLLATQATTPLVLDAQGRPTPLDRLPSFQFIAHSRADIPALLAHIDFVEGVIRDLILDRDGYESGRQAERREVLALLERFRDRLSPFSIQERMDLNDTIKLILRRADTGPCPGAGPFPLRRAAP